jgi:hypothetical protein
MSGLTLGSRQLSTRLVPGILCLEIRWLGHETDLSLSSSVEVKNEWSYASSPAICFYGMYRDFTYSRSVNYSIKIILINIL